MTQAAAAAAGNMQDSPRLAAGFGAALHELWEVASPDPVLDVSDRQELLGAHRASARVSIGDAASLPFDDDQFDMVTAIDVLERVRDPDAALAEMARVARRWLLVAAPRQPLWRLVSLVRGHNLRSLGRNPGHLHHWSRVGFVSLLTRHGKVELIRSPVPWSMLLVRVG